MQHCKTHRILNLQGPSPDSKIQRILVFRISFLSVNALHYPLAILKRYYPNQSNFVSEKNVTNADVSVVSV